MEGKDSHEICNLRNVSRCNSKQFQLIVNEHSKLYFSKSAPPGSNVHMCLFSAVRHCPLWIPLLACNTVA